MSEQSVMNTKVKLLYQRLCKDNWEAYTTGIIIAFLSTLIVAWARSWGATGAVTNWAQWILYGIGAWGHPGPAFAKIAGTNKRIVIRIVIGR